MFARDIIEILGVSVEGGHFLVFTDGFFFLRLVESGWLWVFVHITVRGVGVCKGDLYALLQSWVFVVFS